MLTGCLDELGVVNLCANPDKNFQPHSQATVTFAFKFPKFDAASGEVVDVTLDQLSATVLRNEDSSCAFVSARYVRRH